MCRFFFSFVEHQFVCIVFSHACCTHVQSCDSEERKMPIAESFESSIFFVKFIIRYDSFDIMGPKNGWHITGVKYKRHDKWFVRVLGLRLEDMENMWTEEAHIFHIQSNHLVVIKLLSIMRWITTHVNRTKEFHDQAKWIWFLHKNEGYYEIQIRQRCTSWEYMKFRFFGFCSIWTTTLALSYRYSSSVVWFGLVHITYSLAFSIFLNWSNCETINAIYYTRKIEN